MTFAQTVQQPSSIVPEPQPSFGQSGRGAAAFGIAEPSIDPGLIESLELGELGVVGFNAR